MAGSAMFASRYTPALISRSTCSGRTPACARQACAATEACSIELRTAGSVLTAVAVMAVPIPHTSSDEIVADTQPVTTPDAAGTNRYLAPGRPPPFLRWSCRTRKCEVVEVLPYLSTTA